MRATWPYGGRSVWKIRDPKSEARNPNEIHLGRRVSCCPVIRVDPIPSAKRMKVNSRGRQPAGYSLPGRSDPAGVERRRPQIARPWKGRIKLVMSTYTQIYYHIVFCTKDRVPALRPEKREDLFRYTWGILKNNDCHLYRIGGVEDHVHILTSLHPTVCLADLVKDIKISTSQWIKENGVFPTFTHWQDGYGAFTIARADKDAVTEYIENQPEHHKQVSFSDELRVLLVKFGVQFDEQYLA